MASSSPQNLPREGKEGGGGALGEAGSGSANTQGWIQGEGQVGGLCSPAVDSVIQEMGREFPSVGSVVRVNLDSL